MPIRRSITVRLSMYPVVLAGLAGLSVSVLVAWSCQVRSRIEAVDLLAGSDPRLWLPSRVKSSWRRAATRQEGRGWGRTNFRYRPVGGGRFEEVLLSQSGWPMRALEFQQNDSGRTWSTPPNTELLWAWVVPSRGFPALVAGQTLPLRPLWLGLAVDTLVWGAAFWPVLGGLAIVRGFIRRRRGRCPGCGYPIGISPVCTECGRPVTPRSNEHSVDSAGTKA